MTLDEVMKRLHVLAERVKDNPSEADYLAKKLRSATLAEECLYCGDLAQQGKDVCALCENSPRCEGCKAPCLKLADRENNLCETCAEQSVRAERQAARADWPWRREPETTKDARREVDAVVRGWIQ